MKRTHLHLSVFVVLAITFLASTAWSDNAGWQNKFGSPGPVYTVEALCAFDDGAGEGAAIFAGGSFPTAGNAFAPGIARWTEAGWSDVGGSLEVEERYVEAVIGFDDGSGPVLYVGGRFQAIGGQPANNIAKWDGQRWSNLGSGLGSKDERVTALAIYDDGSGPALYAGGTFQTAGGASASRIAKWDGSTWSSVGGGLSGQPGTFPWVRELAVHDDGSGPALYAAGSFNAAPGVILRNVGRWNGTTWSALGSGVDGEAAALASFDDGSANALYVGGIFNNAGGAPAPKIARWDGSNWSALPSTVTGSFFDAYILSLATYDDGNGTALYAGGAFTHAGPLETNGIARWDGQSWSEVGGGMVPPISSHSIVTSLAVRATPKGSHLVAGGSFRIAGDSVACNIAKFDGSIWSRLESASEQGMEYLVHGLAAHDDGSGAGPQMYAVGDFFQTAGTAKAPRIARFDGKSWQAVGEGGPTSAAGYAISGWTNETGGDTDLIVGGLFNQIDGVPVHNVARWNGKEWSDMPGLPPQGFVLALTRFGEDIYAAGWFGSYGAVFHWTGSTWTQVGPQFDNDVRSILWHDDKDGLMLYAAGGFTSVGGTTANYIARWNGSTWGQVGPGLNAPASALAIFDDTQGSELYVGGEFTSLGNGQPVNHIARWDGDKWNALAEGVLGKPSANGIVGVRALAVVGTQLFVGGRFDAAGGLPANNIAAWDSEKWSELGDGVQLGSIDTEEPNVNALARLQTQEQSSLLVGGDFFLAGGAPASYVAQYSKTVAAPCQADINSTGAVDVDDLLQVINSWGPCDCDADIAPSGGNGVVDVDDLLTVINAWGACP